MTDTSLPATAPSSATASPWWRSAVIYQVYIRSFADGNGDGVGDIDGLRSRLPYLAGLGVDAIWINPWYPSPMKDAGYDVADFRAIEPVFGTLAEAEAMIEQAHGLGIRVLLDLVPNHLSDQHAWFQQALASPPGSPERARFIFRDGRGPDGAEPPNDWHSNFGGPAWTRVTEADGSPGQWYLHLFTPEQPDLDWTNPEVAAEFDDVMHFWFARGVDGFRIDVAHGLAKAEGLPDVGATVWPPETKGRVHHPHWDRDEVHDIYRRWRALADTYEEPRVFVAEAWVHNAEQLAKYIRQDELHTAFNFDFLLAPWLATEMREAIEVSLGAHDLVGAPPTWVLSNHDTVREVSRYARDPQDAGKRHRLSEFLELPADFELGRRRARAAALLMLALPGGAYVYQGEELGLAEVEDIPEEALQDPNWKQSGYTDRGRDGARVPIPWSGDAPPFGFSPDGTQPWLPQPASWRGQTVEDQTGDPESMLELYRRALALRRELPALGDGTMNWGQAPAGALRIDREPGFTCLVNFDSEPVALPDRTQVLVASGELTADGRVPADTAVWLAR